MLNKKPLMLKDLREKNCKKILFKKIRFDFWSKIYNYLVLSEAHVLFNVLSPLSHVDLCSIRWGEPKNLG